MEWPLKAPCTPYTYLFPARTQAWRCGERQAAGGGRQAAAGGRRRGAARVAGDQLYLPIGDKDAPDALAVFIGQPCNMYVQGSASFRKLLVNAAVVRLAP